MLHNRIATELRSHFSTVGPSPLRTPHPTGTAVIPYPIATAGPRLVVPSPAELPPPRPATPQTPPLLPELLSITAHRCASFFAEAAVLVLIFGILDRLLSRGRVELPWIAGTFAATLLLLAASILTDISARRWLRTH